jgi:hypothetical protein
MAATGVVSHRVSAAMTLGGSQSDRCHWQAAESGYGSESDECSMKHVGLLISLQQKRCEDSDNAALSRNVATKGDTFACDRYRDTLSCCWAGFEMNMTHYSDGDRPRPLAAVYCNLHIQPHF